VGEAPGRLSEWSHHVMGIVCNACAGR
jgi:hypothetical protein